MSVTVRLTDTGAVIEAATAAASTFEVTYWMLPGHAYQWYLKVVVDADGLRADGSLVPGD